MNGNSRTLPGGIAPLVEIVSGTPRFVLSAGAEVGGVEGRLFQARGMYGEGNEGETAVSYLAGEAV